MNKLTQQLKLSYSQILHHPLYEKYSIFIIPGLTGIIGSLMFIFLTLPQIFKIIAIETQITEITDEQSVNQDRINTLEKIDLNFYKTSLDNSLIALPNDKDIPGAITSILDLLSNSGLKLDNFAFSPSTLKEAGAESLLVKTDVSGTLDQIKNLISISNSSSRLIKIVGIAFSGGQGDTVQASLDLVVFYTPLDIASTQDSKIELINEGENKILQLINENNQKINLNAPLQDVPSGKSDPFN